MGRWNQPRWWIGLAALLSFLLSVGLWFSGHREQALFVGLWVPTILALGTFVLLTRPEAPRGGV